jgi:DUF1680 family protein
MHKYNLIGLLSYYQATGDKKALEASKCAADLLHETFVVQGNSLRRASAHVGMAATSVLEPMATLYRLTGEQRYLDFCHLIIDSWEQPDDPETDAKELASSITEACSRRPTRSPMRCYPTLWDSWLCIASILTRAT